MSMKGITNTLCWIDLETTGLTPETDVILEVACIITHEDTEVIATFNEVIHQPIACEFAKYTVEDLANLDLAALAKDSRVHEKVIDMHIRNGLWRESAMASPSYAKYADNALADFIKYHCDGDQPQLAGSTISFDRAFLAKWFPFTAKAVHYRNVDVTTLNEIARRNWRDMHDNRPRSEANHRALSDIQSSIETYQYYVNQFNGAIAS